MKTYPWWPPKGFVYVDSDAVSHANRAAVTWAIDKAREELSRPEPILGFLYGTATYSRSGELGRIVFTVNTGGANSLVLDLMTHFAGNLKEQAAKGGMEWFAHAPLRKRLIIRLLMLLA